MSSSASTSSSPDFDTSIVHLNIGGAYYATCKSTLTRDSQYFRNLLSDQWCPSRDGKGCIFIDRDGKRFRHVLNFLREGKIHMSDPALAEELITEAEYFQLEELKAVLLKSMKELRRREQRERDAVAVATGYARATSNSSPSLGLSIADALQGRSHLFPISPVNSQGSSSAAESLDDEAFSLEDDF